MTYYLSAPLLARRAAELIRTSAPLVRIARVSPGWPDRVGMTGREIGCNDGLCVVYLTVTGQRVTVRETDIDRIDQEGQTDD